MKQGRYISGLFFSGVLLIAACVGCNHEPLNGSTYTVGIVNLNEELDDVFLGFKKYLAEKGYEEGKNITYLYYGSRKDRADLETDLQGMIAQKVDLILSITTPATKKAKQMTSGTNIPVVFAPVFDPVESGIVQSLVRPGGNITGIKVGGVWRFDKQEIDKWLKSRARQAKQVK